MNKKLKAFADEMIKEIKNLKDLTKKEIPEVAKEYIKFNKTISLIGGILFAIVAMVGGYIIVCGFSYIPTHEYDDAKTGYYMVGGLISAIGIFASIANLYNYLQFLYMPRRKAIEAITSLFGE